MNDKTTGADPKETAREKSFTKAPRPVNKVTFFAAVFFTLVVITGIVLIGWFYYFGEN